MSHDYKFPTGLQLSGSSIVGPMGDFYGTLGECSSIFAHRLIERSNVQPELIAALRLFLDLCPRMSEDDPIAPALENACRNASALLAKVSK